jgi:hypothetical protein
LQVFATTKLLAAVYISTCWLYEALTQQNFHEAATCITLGYEQLCSNPQSSCTQNVHTTCTYLVPFFMQALCFISSICSFIYFFKILIAAVYTVLGHKKLYCNKCSFLLCETLILYSRLLSISSCCLFKTLLQHYWLLVSLQLLAM